MLRLDERNRISKSFAALCWQGSLKKCLMREKSEKLTVKALFEGDKLVVVQGLNVYKFESLTWDLRYLVHLIVGYIKSGLNFSWTLTCNIFKVFAGV
jgi:hypothetical protein